MLDLKGKRLVLASKSSRRAHLLQLLGLDFDIMDSEIEEVAEKYTMPEVHVLELAQKKAIKVAEEMNEGFSVGADTIVVLNGEILGKPQEMNQAREMLKKLSGKTHAVYTGFAIVEKPTGRMVSDYERTQVTFRALEDAEIENYIQTENPMDKAGAYGIQDQSAIFAKKINGCFYNVVGLPLTKFYLTFRDFLQTK